MNWTEDDLAAYRQKHGGVPHDNTPPPPATDKTTEPESELQARCEAWLTWKGYAKRTPKHMQTHKGGRWQIHLTDTKGTLKGNPIMPDLLLIDSTRGRYLEVELKVKGGRLSPDQNAMVFRGEWGLAWNMEQFKAIVLAWESNTVDKV